MKKEDIIAALTEAGIPHDPEAKAADLDALFKAALSYAEKMGENYVAQIDELEDRLLKMSQDNDTKRAQIAELESRPPLVDEGPDEGQQAINEMIAEKVKAGLRPEQAAAVVQAQIEADTAAWGEESPEDETSSEAESA